MPLYSYRCNTCRRSVDLHTAHDSVEKGVYDTGNIVCRECPGLLKRDFRFTVASNPFGDGYYDPGVGQFVRTKNQLEDACKQASEDATARTGLEHRFRPVDADQIRATMDDQGMKSTHDRAVAEGRIEPTAKLVL